MNVYLSVTCIQTPGGSFQLYSLLLSSLQAGCCTMNSAEGGDAPGYQLSGEWTRRTHPSALTVSVSSWEHRLIGCRRANVRASNPRKDLMWRQRNYDSSDWPIPGDVLLSFFRRDDRLRQIEPTAAVHPQQTGRCSVEILPTRLSLFVAFKYEL